jgi:hypothetical protein
LQDRARRNSPGINERVQIGNIRKLLAARYRDGRSVSCRNCRDTQIETVDVEAVARRTCRSKTCRSNLLRTLNINATIEI